MSEERDKRLEEAAKDEPEWPLGADIRSLLADYRVVKLTLDALGPRLTEARAGWERAEARVRELEATIKVQANAVRMLDRKERAEYVATQTLDSQREANALLTEQLERAEAENEALRAERDRLLRGDTYQAVLDIGYQRGMRDGSGSRAALASGEESRAEEPGR